jgi:hypothetical protein
VLIQYLQRWLTTPVEKTSSPQIRFWFGLSLSFAIFYGIQALQPAFSHEYIIQDDARQHVFGLLRFWDPQLFPHDLIADYYQSKAPLGYTTLYRLLAAAGIDPIRASNLLPMILGLIATGYAFGVSMQILPIPAAGFISALLFNYMLWEAPILVGATPRSFAHPLLLVFLYYLLRRSLFPCLIAIALQGLFYPPSVLVTAGILILRLLHWKRGWPRLSLDRSNAILCAAGLGIVFLVLLPQVFDSSNFGPTISGAEAKTLPEFLPGGRVEFFTNNPWDFWFNSHRSSLSILNWGPPILYAALLLPILLRYPSRFPLARQVTSNIAILVQMIFVSLGLFAIAHALLFKLYLPTRYGIALDDAIRLLTGSFIIILLDAAFRSCEHFTKISLKTLGIFGASYIGVITLYWFAFYYPGEKKLLVILLVLGAGVGALCLGIDGFSQPEKLNGRSYWGQQLLAVASTTVITVLLLAYPSLVKDFPKTDYFVGEVPQLYEFLATQPKDTLIASLASEADNIPSFAQRSVLVSREYALPYEVGYYKQIRQRTIDLINAQYSPDPEQVRSFIQKYEVDFWLLDRDAFTPEYIDNPNSWSEKLTSRWIQQYQPAATEAVEQLKQGSVPALAKVMDRCSVFKNDTLMLLQAECIRQESAQ